MARLHHPPRAAGLAFVSIALVAGAIGPTASAAGLGGVNKDRVCAAIDVLKTYDACCKTESPAGFSPAISVSACLEKLKKDRICVKSLSGSKKGEKTSDDRSADCTDKDLILISETIVQPKSTREFIRLVAILYHEGTHALQDLSKLTTSSYFDKVTGPLEVQAWRNNQLVAQALKGALRLLYDNRRNGRAPDEGMTDCQKKLVACWLDTTNLFTLGSLLSEACLIDKESDKTISGITAWLEKKCPPATPPTGAPRNHSLRKDGGGRSIVSGPGDPLIRDIESSASDPLDIVETDLDTGLSEILGLDLSSDAGGVDHLVVSGHRNGAGIVQTWRDATPGVPDGMTLVAETDVSAVTRAPGGLVPFGPGGASGLLLWDELQGQMYAMLDTNADGLAETLDPAPRYELPLDASGYVRLGAADAGEFVLERIAIGTMTGNLPAITVVDSDLNGRFDPADVFFEVRPLDDPRRAAASALPPTVGAQSFTGSGASGHQVQLVRTDGMGGVIGPLGPPAVVGNDNRFRFALPAPLQPGTFVRIADLTNGTLSEEYPVVPPAPLVYAARGNVGPGAGGAEVFQEGLLLDTLGLTDVLVGGVSALSFSVSSLGATYVAPPNVPVPGDGITDKGLVVDVQLVYDDGSALVPVTLEAQPFAYVDPILTPEFACRIGNVNAALGPVTDVLFANGSAGIGAARKIFVDRSAPFVLSMAAPPSKPLGPSRFAAYATVGEPTAARVRTLPFGLGDMCQPTPLSGGGPPRPKETWNNIGKTGRLGVPTRASSPAPTQFLVRMAGVGKRVTFTVQALILDSASLQGQAAVSNAIVVVAE